jgi:hypothetical protein
MNGNIIAALLGSRAKKKEFSERKTDTGEAFRDKQKTVETDNKKKEVYRSAAKDPQGYTSMYRKDVDYTDTSEAGKSYRKEINYDENLKKTSKRVFRRSGDKTKWKEVEYTEKGKQKYKE